MLNRVLLSLLVVVGFVRCSSSEQKDVVYLYPTSSFVRFVKEGEFMMKHLNKLGVNTKMYNGNDDDALQLSQGMEALDNGADLLIISAINSNTIAPLVREAQDRGVPVIAYNRLISNVDYELFVTGNNADNGRLFCERALQTHPTGNYVILAGDRFDRNGVEQKAAIDSILAPHVKSGKVKIIYESHIENWNSLNAAHELEQVINNYGNEIDVVIACSDPMAQGVIGVLEKYKLNGRVFVTGQDAELASVKNILNGNQHMTIYHPQKDLGEKTAELAIALLKGKSASSLKNGETYNGHANIPTYQVKSVEIHKGNVESELINKGVYTWSELQ